MCVICFCVNKNINISIKPKTIFSIVKRVYNNKKKKKQIIISKVVYSKKIFYIKCYLLSFLLLAKLDTATSASVLDSRPSSVRVRFSSNGNKISRQT